MDTRKWLDKGTVHEEYKEADVGRFDRLRQIQGLDPERDYEQIFRLDTQYEFPLEIGIGTELAQIYTFAIPSIGGLLGRTGEFTQRPVKRADDTALLLAEVQEHGFASERAKQAVRRVNRLHAPYGISQADFLYVLATFAVAPVRFTDAYGWRPFSEQERSAIYHYYRRLGEHMAIKDIPGSYAELAEFMDAYEVEHLAYSVGGHKVAMANRDRMARDLFPKFPLTLARGIVDVVVPEHIRRALDLPEPGRVTRILTTLALRARRTLQRYAPAPTKAVGLFDFNWRRTYPDGYEIDQLGPRHATTSGCPVLHTEQPPVTGRG